MSPIRPDSPDGTLQPTLDEERLVLHRLCLPVDWLAIAPAGLPGRRSQVRVVAW